MPLAHNIPPPQANRQPETFTLHGQARTDNYSWIRDPNWAKVLKNPDLLSSEIREHLEAENAYTEALTATLGDLREDLFEEMKARVNEDDSSPPTRVDDYWYYTRVQAGKQYPIYCRRKGSMSAPEEVYFDANKAAAGLEFYKTAAVLVSPDHSRLALVEDTNGSEVFTLRVINIASGDELTSPFSGVAGDLVWAADSNTLFYTVVDKNHRPCAVYRHQVGTDPSDNQPVYREKDSAFFLDLDKSADKSLILIHAGGHTNSEWHYLSADTPRAHFKCFKKRVADMEYNLDYADGSFFIRTNADGATDFKICRCSFLHNNQEDWEEIIPHSPGHLVQGFVLTENTLVRQEMHEATPRIVLLDMAKGSEREITFDEAAFDLALYPSPMYETETIRFAYDSPATPPQVYDYNLRDGSRELVKEDTIPSGHTPDDYIVRRTTAISHDGAEVPVTVFFHKDTPQDGTAPLWLYGYGAYGLAMPADFSRIRLSLVNRGFVFAIAHIRGGTEKGYGWYLDSKKEKKVNTFHDYIAAAEQLITEGYTTPGNIYAEGASAGGMLMGTVTNMRPDLWKLVHLGVPFVDVLNTMADADLPLTPPEWPEWGNPVESQDDYNTIAGYCAYNNLTAQDYPHTLITSSLTDYRVTYWEPAKYAAKMREVNTADTLTIMKMEMATGHQGASGRYDKLKEYAFEYALVLTIFGRV